jgi:hypothetical protein
MSRRHQFDEEVFRAIRSEDLGWKPFAAYPPAAASETATAGRTQAAAAVASVGLGITSHP